MAYYNYALTNGNDVAPGNGYPGGLNDQFSIYGLAGNDIISTGYYADYLDGGDGDDNLFGHGGADTLLGGNGDDTLNGDTEADLLVIAQGAGQAAKIGCPARAREIA